MPDNQRLRVTEHPRNPLQFAVEVLNSAGEHFGYRVDSTGRTRSYISREQAQEFIDSLGRPVLILGGNAYRLDGPNRLQTAPMNADGSFANYGDEWSGDIDAEAWDEQCRVAYNALSSIQGLL